MSLIDIAHAKMTATPDDASARLGFYDVLAGSELFVLLESEQSGDQVDLKTVIIEELEVVLAFDSDTRLSQFAGETAPYAALSGRVLAATLTGQPYGLGLNLEVAPSAIIIPPEGITWLNQTLSQPREDLVERPSSVGPPTGISTDLLARLDRKLAMASGLAEKAFLCSLTFENGDDSQLLAFINTLPGAEGALQQLASETLSFGGFDTTKLDIAFLADGDPQVARLEKVGLRFDLPQPAVHETPERKAPGSDGPPRLR